MATIILGPIFSTSYYYLINVDATSTSVTSCRLIITISVGLIDSVVYGIGLYLSIQTINEFHNQQIFSSKEIIHYHKHFQSIITHEKHLLQSINQVTDLLIENQMNLHDVMKDVIKDNQNHTDSILIQNIRNKLEILKFIEKDGLMTIKENINDSLQLLKFNLSINKNHQQLHETYFNDIVLLNSYLFNRIYLFIFTFSFLLYIHQILLWFFQYLTLNNPDKYFSYSFILSIIILSQSLGLIYFIEITKTFSYLSLLYIYACIFFIRSFITLVSILWGS
ncbi:unnamed protein product [Rotaria sordida]|uniref:Uncharacterized protein n=1 Tax=Rotaria sordida TaxID=392033 RepID=A0A815KTE6_9BILA|nr:unnamed protein product [Rotaria sordida]CAF3990730.1 unnamed protein product [Rotaria sordida]